MSFRLTIILSLLLIIVSRPSFANVGAGEGDSIYNYTREYPAGSSGAGDLTYISLGYDIQEDGLSGGFSLVERNNLLADTNTTAAMIQPATVTPRCWGTAKTRSTRVATNLPAW